jgi:hypothetical protein
MSNTMIGTMKELIAQVQQLEAAKAAAEARAKDAETLLMKKQEEYTNFWKNIGAKRQEWFERYQLLASEVFLVGRELGQTVMQNVYADEQKVRKEMAGLVEACKKLRSEAQAQARAEAEPEHYLDDGWEYPWHATGDSAGHSDGAAVDALADNIRARVKDYNVSLVKAQKWIEGPGALCLAQKALDKGSYKWIEATVGSEEYVRAFLDVLKRVGINAYINDVPGGGFSLKVDMNGVRSWAASSRGA